MTHVGGASSAVEAVAQVASEAGAVPLPLTDVLAPRVFTAAAVVLRTDAQPLHNNHPQTKRAGDPDVRFCRG